MRKANSVKELLEGLCKYREGSDSALVSREIAKLSYFLVAFFFFLE